MLDIGSLYIQDGGIATEFIIFIYTEGQAISGPALKQGLSLIITFSYVTCTTAFIMVCQRQQQTHY